MSETENSFFEINGWKVHFETFGSGPNPILLIPGALGTGRTDFGDLLDGEDELDFDKFTVIAVEAPGWGRSRPPLRKYDNKVYNNDCECFHGVMQHLGYDKYSIIGFSEGAKVALLMAIEYPEDVISVILSAMCTTSLKGVDLFIQSKSVDNWHSIKLNAFLKVYKTKDEIQKLWNRFLKFCEFYHQYFPEDIYKDRYHLVRCPVLVTHGDKDPLMEVDQVIKLCERLEKVKLYRFPLGGHECHQKYTAQYTKLVQDHFLNKFIESSDLIANKGQSTLAHLVNVKFT